MGEEAFLNVSSLICETVAGREAEETRKLDGKEGRRTEASRGRVGYAKRKCEEVEMARGEEDKERGNLDERREIERQSTGEEEEYRSTREA